MTLSRKDMLSLRMLRRILTGTGSPGKRSSNGRSRLIRMKPPSMWRTPVFWRNLAVPKRLQR